ncbi:hypothetical protein BD289DRAFT_28822 [Coniella lustricola]|uniref:Uncharacterized protein n=1 Tax=Coniella lustricola TaxID=2025994 RepID=A0A2T3AJ93_9PEZI|nr:hypothetical protein BD289DRAFT_28822 [Coniella lustricola]
MQEDTCGQVLCAMCYGNFITAMFMHLDGRRAWVLCLTGLLLFLFFSWAAWGWLARSVISFPLMLCLCSLIFLVVRLCVEASQDPTVVCAPFLWQWERVLPVMTDSDHSSCIAHRAVSNYPVLGTSMLLPSHLQLPARDKSKQRRQYLFWAGRIGWLPCLACSVLRLRIVSFFCWSLDCSG